MDLCASVVDRTREQGNRFVHMCSSNGELCRVPLYYLLSFMCKSFSAAIATAKF